MNRTAEKNTRSIFGERPARYSERVTRRRVHDGKIAIRPIDDDGHEVIARYILSRTIKMTVDVIGFTKEESTDTAPLRKFELSKIIRNLRFTY